MKTRSTIWVIALFAITCTLSVFAQVATNAPPASDLPPLPQSTAEIWVLAIAGLTPLITGAIYWLVPRIPKLLLPTLTPFIGIALGLGLKALGKANLGWVDMAQAGALAVFVREVFNQAVKTQPVQKMLKRGSDGPPPSD